MSQNAGRRRRLTVAMVTHQDAPWLEATLSSVEPIADEIVVVDRGSSDRTVAIASSRGARFIPHRWSDDFSAARNEALASARGDWVLWLEPGETLQADALAELRAFIDVDAQPHNSYTLFVETPPGDPQGLSEQAALLRLMPRRGELRFSGRVRESLLPAIAAHGLNIEITPWRIERDPHVHDEAFRRRGAQQTKNLALRAIGDEGPQPRLLIALGEAHHTLEDPAQAMACFRQAIALSERASTEMLEAYYGMLATFEATDEGRERQLECCLEALEIFPFDAQLLCAVGGYLQAAARLDLSVRAYKAAYDFGQVDLQTAHVRNIAEVAAVCQSLVLQVQNNDEAALAALHEAVGRFPQSRRLRRELLELHVKHARLREALEQVDALPPDTPYLAELRTAVRGACSAAAGNWRQALVHLRAAYDHRCRDPICLRWFASTLLATGDMPRAEEVIAQWSRVEPHNEQIRKFAEAARTPGPATAATVLPLARKVAATPLASGPSSAEELQSLRTDAARHPQDPAKHVRLGQALASAGQASEAERVWRDFLRRVPNEPLVLSALAEWLLRNDRESEALALSPRLAEGPPEVKPFVEFLSGVSALVGLDRQAALRSFDTAHQRGYSGPLYERYRRRCLAELGHER